MPEPEVFLGMPEIAKLLDCSRQWVHQLTQRDHFPEPDATVGGRPLWRQATIQRWMARPCEPWTDRPGSGGSMEPST